MSKRRKASPSQKGDKLPDLKAGKTGRHPLDWRWWAAGALIAMTVVAYWRALHGEFLWDDDSNIVKRAALRTLQGLGQIWFSFGATQQYYPLTHTTFWLDYHLWGLNPLPYHLENILLHAANVVLLWRVLQRLNIKGAWLGAALFALHPVNVESVAWITERKNVLSGLFFLLSILAALRFWFPDDAAGRAAPSVRFGPWKFYWLSLGLYLCALFAKTAAVPLPAVILLLIWWRRGRAGLNDVYRLAPFLALGLAVGLITMWVEKHNVGATGTEWTLGPVERCLVSARILWFDLGKLLWPHPLMFMYPRWEVQAGQPLAYLPALAAVAGLGILWRNRNVWARASLLAVGCFIAMVFPVLAIFNQFFFRYSFVNDHFLYLPGIGPLALAAAGISSTLLWINNKNVVPNWLPAGALLLLLGVLTWNQTGIYRSSEALWNDTLEKNPDSWMAHNNLGHIVLARGQVDEAAAHYSRAHLINPHDPVVSYDLAVALSVQGKFEDAVQHYREAVALDPGYFAAYNNLGNALMRLQRIDEAMDAYQSALRLNPTNSGVLNNLGGALLGRKQYAEAAGYLKTASQSAPGSVETHFNLGQAYEGLGKRDEAVKEFTEALRLKPDFVPARQHLQALEAGIGK